MGLLSALRSNVLPAKGAGANQTLRGDDYGNLFVNEGLRFDYAAALEGSLFVARVAPAVGGSGVALGIVTTFVDTTPAVVLSNLDPAKSYIPLYLRGRVTAAGASSTSAEIAVQVDNTNRFTSGGTALAVSNVSPAAAAPASNAVVNVGAVLAAAAGARKRNLGSAILKIAAAPLWLVNDVILLTFGAIPSFVHQASVVASDAAVPVVTAHVPLPACAVPPSGSLVAIMANVANAVTPPSIEWELAWIER